MYRILNSISRNARARQVWGQLDLLRRRLMTGMQSGLPSLAAIELTVPQSMVLFHLAGNGPQSVTALVRVTGRAQGTTSHLVAQLEKAGLVERVADADDARRTIVRLKPRGRRVVDQVEVLRLDAFMQAVARLPPTVMAQLDAALAAVHEALDQQEQER